MKSLKHLLESKLSYKDIPWLSKDILYDAMNIFDDWDTLYSTEFDEKYPNILFRNIKLLESYLSWIKYGQKNIKWNIDDIYKYILNINKRHLDNFLGRGSEGIVFDAGDYVIKLFSNNEDALKRINNYIKRWCEYKGDLETIPHIKKYDKDFRWIAIEKVNCPCKEGKLIDRCMKYCYCISNIIDDPEKNLKLKEYINSEPIEDTTFVINWSKQFASDYKSIMGPNSTINDDVKSTNIGKTKDGRVVCFDWCADII